MEFLPAAIIAAALVLLLGCVQVDAPKGCAALPAEDRPGCIYYSAVNDQNPYACYAIKNSTDRETCIKDAIDPSAKKKLQRTVKTGKPGAAVPVAKNPFTNQTPSGAAQPSSEGQGAAAEEQNVTVSQPPQPAPGNNETPSLPEGAQ